MSFSDVIREFQRRGIGDEDQIAEHVAFLLLVCQFSVDQGVDLRRHIGDRPDEFRHFMRNLTEEMIADGDREVFPQPMPDDNNWIDGVYSILRWLTLVSVEESFNFGDFFQQQVRYHLLRSSRGERYPTPHHIATFMAQLVLPQEHLHHFEDMSIFDPTCGTGGLLAAAHQFQPEIEYVGCDYNTRWARLAYANLRLHGVRNFQIYAQAAQQFQSFDSRIYQPSVNRTFDYILMNPPFDSGVVFELLALALHSLFDGGRAALLVPSGVVQRSDDRASLLENGLQAIITLPPDAFRPYNGIRSHILLVDKSQNDSPIWLCALQADGYGTGMSRPLDQPMYPQASELPRTLDLFGQRSVWSYLLTIADDQQLEIAVLNPYKGDKQHPSGLALRFSGAGAQPTTWVGYTSAKGTLLWWEEQGFLQAEMYLYATYDAATAVLLQRIQVEEITWATYLSAVDGAPSAAAWQGPENSNIGLTWTADTLTLQQSGRGHFAALPFTLDSTAVNGALLLDEAGTPVSIWYHAALPPNVETAIISAGQSLKDWQGNVVAWLLPFTADEETLTLLLTKATTVTLFAPAEHEVHYGLLNEVATEETSETGGVWSIGAGRLATSNGQRLNSTLRTADGKALGIAFGPQAENREEASLFALCIERTALAQRPLEPERYLPEARSPEKRQHPAQILAEIRQQQRKMDRRMDALLSALSQDSAAAFVDAMPLPLPLISALNRVQHNFWQQLAGCTDIYLTTMQIEELGQGAGLTAVEVRQQLDLLVSLGLLLPVTVAAGEDQASGGLATQQELQPFYRCVRQSDVKV